MPQLSVISPGAILDLSGRPTVSQLVRDVQTNCISAGLKPPHRRTINARLEEIDLQKRAKRRGENEIAKQTQAVTRVFPASRPLQVVQVDHTKTDIFVVDEETRQPIGRPLQSGLHRSIARLQRTCKSGLVSS
ncbi:hypothetical protein [Sinorhizobium meliloti]|uniref:hypothetical protein n=1 Tax=Rhizobium meliloti TaxID=382 RepID=UPI001F438074|nr:hypothetical protein [Sinorhizobium meliloti]